MLNTFLIIGAAMGIIGGLPEMWRGLRWIATRTKTKKDDSLMDKVDGK